MRRGWLVFALAVLAVAACTGLPAPTASPSIPPNEIVGATIAPLATGEVPLPTRPPADRSDTACGGVGLDAVLAGDPSDPRVAWLVDQLDGPGFGRRLDVVWPDDYRARFAPNLVVLDQTDTVVLRAGDPVGGACVQAGNLLLIEPPFQ